MYPDSVAFTTTQFKFFLKYIFWTIYLFFYNKALSYPRITTGLLKIFCRFITDKTDFSKIFDLSKLITPAKIFQVSYLSETIRPSPCPVEDNEENHFVPKPFYTTPFGNAQHTVVVHVQDVEKLLAIFDNTVTNCTFVYDAGIYHQDSRFLFLVGPEDNAGEYTEKILNSSPHIAKHR